MYIYMYTYVCVYTYINTYSVKIFVVVVVVLVPSYIYCTSVIGGVYEVDNAIVVFCFVCFFCVFINVYK